VEGVRERRASLAEEGSLEPAENLSSYISEKLEEKL
jgi:hypothetical protein